MWAYPSIKLSIKNNMSNFLNKYVGLKNTTLIAVRSKKSEIIRAVRIAAKNVTWAPSHDSSTEIFDSRG